MLTEGADEADKFRSGVSSACVQLSLSELFGLGSMVDGAPESLDDS